MEKKENNIVHTNLEDNSVLDNTHIFSLIVNKNSFDKCMTIVNAIYDIGS